MELKVYKDIVSASEVICDTKAEVPIETELLIPDYLPEVFKIVKCFIKLVVLQKHISQSRFTVEGYMRCLVYYQTQDSQGLCQIEQKIPFKRQTELRDGDYHSFDALVTGETEYLNCRAVSSRRLDIRGAYILSVRVCTELEQEIMTAISENGIEQKLLPLTGIKELSSADKIITAEENIAFETAPEVILDTVCCSVVSEVKLIQGKAVVKGILNTEISYRSSGDNAIIKSVKQIPFNEILEIENAGENGQALVFVEPTGCTILAGADGGECSITVTALITVRVFMPCEYFVVADAFSTQYDTDIRFKNIIINELRDSFNLEISAVATGQLPQENLKIIDVKAEALPIELIDEDGETILRGRAEAHIICQNEQGELESYDKVAEFSLPKKYLENTEKLQATCFAQIKSVSARKVGAQTEVTMIVSVNGIVTKQNSAQVVEFVECLDERESVSSDIALHIYYAQERENIFDIAKRYGASPAAIANSNGVEQGTLLSKQQLLIPS